MLARELRTEAFPDLGDVVPEDHGVGASEVDVLEDASRLARACELVDDAHTRQRLVALDGDDLAGTHLTDRLRLDEVEGAGLRGDDDRFAEPPENERPESVRVARGVNAARCQEDDGVRPFDLRERIDQRAFESDLPRTRDQMDDDLGVRHGVEDGAVRLEPPADVGTVDEVAVMRQRDRPLAFRAATGWRVTGN